MDEDEDFVVLPITDEMDLHPFRPKEIRSVAEEYLKEAYARGFTQVRLVHGKGIGVQKEIIKNLLMGMELVDRFADAPGWRGGWGATVVWFKTRDPLG